MIVVRDTFYLKFGKAKDAKALIKNFNEIVKKYDNTPRRFLTDFTGESYRLILESTFQDLGAFEKTLQSHFGKEEWREWYEIFIPLVNRSEREILNILE
ncbi:MAG: hypothetical protein HXY50_01320 [Ignavibacteriaceae bacterium]|nr:hypothetical protein [Ignavibacteriaceae bacterium]